MTLKQRLLRIWQGDPEREREPADVDRPLTRRELNKLAGESMENERPTQDVPNTTGALPFL